MRNPRANVLFPTMRWMSSEEPARVHSSISLIQALRGTRESRRFRVCLHFHRRNPRASAFQIQRGHKLPRNPRTRARAREREREREREERKRTQTPLLAFRLRTAREALAKAENGTVRGSDVHERNGIAVAADQGFQIGERQEDGGGIAVGMDAEGREPGEIAVKEHFHGAGLVV